MPPAIENALGTMVATIRPRMPNAPTEAALTGTSTATVIAAVARTAAHYSVLCLPRRSTMVSPASRPLAIPIPNAAAPKAAKLNDASRT